MSKAKKGPLKDTAIETMMAHVINAVLTDSGLHPSLIEEVVFGNVLENGSGALQARMAQFLARMDVRTPVSSVNRLCSSGLESCAIIASKIKAGVIDIGIGGGVESMSRGKISDVIHPSLLGEKVKWNKMACECMVPMGNCSEELSRRFRQNRR